MMWEDVAVLVILFVCLIVVGFAAITLRSGASTKASKRIIAWRNARASDSGSSDLTKHSASALGRDTLKRISLVLASLSSVRSSELTETRELLRQSGFRSPSAVRVFSGARVVLELALFIVAANFARVYDLALAETIAALLCMFTLGRFIPTYGLTKIRDRRHQRVVEILPEFMDLLSICLGSGLGVQDAMLRITDEVRELDPVFGEELHVSMLEVAAGVALDEALKGLVVRCGTAELRSLVSVLSQSTRYGSGVCESLDEYAESIRSSRLVLAEGQAETAPTKMLFPTMLILFSTLAAILGPMFWRVTDALGQ
jgi:tight adherence protein C